MHVAAAHEAGQDVWPCASCLLLGYWPLQPAGRVRPAPQTPCHALSPPPAGAPFALPCPPLRTSCMHACGCRLHPCPERPAGRTQRPHSPPHAPHPSSVLLLCRASLQLLRVVRVGKVLHMLKMYRLLRIIRLPRIMERLEAIIDRGVLQVRGRGAGWGGWGWGLGWGFGWGRTASYGTLFPVHCTRPPPQSCRTKQTEGAAGAGANDDLVQLD